jgi:hypothetical protein
VWVGPGNLTVGRRPDAVPMGIWTSGRTEFAAPAGSLMWSDLVGQLVVRLRQSVWRVRRFD